jgi:hypothetical protein
MSALTLVASSATLPELSSTVQRTLWKATLALIEGDARLAEVALRDCATMRGQTVTPRDFPAAAELRRVVQLAAEIAALARVRAGEPRPSLDRAHADVRSAARRANAIIEAAAGQSAEGWSDEVRSLVVAALTRHHMAPTLRYERHTA